jgi:hypothetical protein
VHQQQLGVFDERLRSRRSELQSVGVVGIHDRDNSARDEHWKRDCAARLAAERYTRRAARNASERAFNPSRRDGASEQRIGLHWNRNLRNVLVEVESCLLYAFEASGTNGEQRHAGELAPQAVK